MISIIMNNIKTKIDGVDTLPFNIVNNICVTCSYQKIGFNVEPRKYLFNPQTGMTYTGLVPDIVKILKQNKIDYVIQDKRNKPEKQYD